MRRNPKIKAPEPLVRMLERYTLASLQDYKNAVKEIVQEIALLGLWRAKFFEKAAFYGGTALRILHGLDRFSEDLDFTLLQPNPDFEISAYELAIARELHNFGFEAHVEKKPKSKQSAIDSAFIKIHTVQHLLLIGLPKGMERGMHPDELVKIRLEVDTDPPEDGAVTENALLLMPSPFSVKTLRLEDLFAGKVHAVLCRAWKGRVKGRDWYDLVWFAARAIRLNLHYLEQRMRQSGHWEEQRALTLEDVHALFEQKCAKVDFAAAKEDVQNFIHDQAQLDLWSPAFFQQIVHRILPL